MSGLDEQLTAIDKCPECDNSILTWKFKGKIGNGIYNIDKSEYNRLNNTVFLFDGMDFSNIESACCYSCGYHNRAGSMMFKSIMRKAESAVISREWL